MLRYVIPAKAGIQVFQAHLDPRLRGGDVAFVCKPFHSQSNSVKLTRMGFRRNADRGTDNRAFINAIRHQFYFVTFQHGIMFSQPIPLPTSPLKGEEAENPLPFKGRVRVGMGYRGWVTIVVRRNPTK